MAKNSVALIFGGQGSQKVGMGLDLWKQWKSHLSPLFEEVNSSLGFDLKKIMFEGPQSTLTETRHAQPAILMHSQAIMHILQKEIGFNAAKTSHYVLGHSLGEYSAIVAASSLDCIKAASLVHKRGKAMEDAMNGTFDQGAMGALIPIDAKDAEEICKKVEESTNEVCQVANYNSPKQIVISGSKAGVEKGIELAKSLKRVRRAILLDVGAPFHCKLMDPAAQIMKKELEKIQFSPFTIPLISNVTAQEVKECNQLSSLLTEQITAPVRWSQSVDFCVQNGISTFIEIGTCVLTPLLKQQLPKANCITVSNSDQLMEFIKTYPPMDG